jgi:hypothetical protein
MAGSTGETFRLSTTAPAGLILPRALPGSSSDSPTFVSETAWCSSSDAAAVRSLRS